MISHLCDWRTLRGDDVANILGRGKDYVTRTYLYPMVRDGLLRFTFPDQPAHPQQAYTTSR